MAQGSEKQKLKVFISYSRKDASFAEELVAGLQVAGFAPYLDKHDIAPGEPWEERLRALIGAADTVVFVISPDSIASERCAWEVAETEQLRKRLLPIVWRTVADADVPERLKRLHFIFFSEGYPFARSLVDLASALNTDLEWIREHTRLADAATRWNRRREPHALLLGKDVDDAETWLNRHPKEGPEPTALQQEFISASRQAQRSASRRAQQIRSFIGLLIMAVVSVAWLAYEGWLDRSYLTIQARRFADIYMPTNLSPEEEKTLKPGEHFRECASCPQMVVLPPGEYMMGSPAGSGDRDELPQHKVTILTPFAVSKREVRSGRRA